MRGFILTPTYRIRRGVPEVHLYGVLESGESCLVVDDRPRPYFFVPASKTADARRLAPRAEIGATGFTSFAGDPVARIAVSSPADVPPLRARLEAAGVQCFEADVRFAHRYLIDRGIRGAFEVDGRYETHAEIGRVYRNPEIAPAHWLPALRVLSIDIETSPNADRLYSIALCVPPAERVLMVYDRPVAGAETLPSEESLLRRFVACVRDLDPDIITGWNVVDFDLAVIQRHCRRLGVRCALGRTDEELDIRTEAAFGRESRAVAVGRQVLDGLSLMRGAFIRLDDYKLETAARAFLGKGKLFSGPDRHAEIDTAYRSDPERLAEYNLRDARLVAELFAHTKLIDLAVRRSLLTGMPLDRVSAAIASVDALYLAEARRREVVAPSVGAEDRDARILGGYVMDSMPGLYRNILVFDFKSLYPSIIRTFNLDPLTYRPAPGGDRGAAMRAPNGAWFLRRPPGILPELVARLAAEREQAKRAGDAVAANAVKILMNSLYGVLGSGASRLFGPEVANAVTHFGQHLIQFAAAWARERGYAVIYGDTDSLFVDAREADEAAASELGRRLAAAMTAAVAEHVGREFGCESYLELEFEKRYRRFFLPEVRGGAVGSKKRYAGLLDGGAIEFVGLESVRRDWTEASKRFQHDLLQLVFHDRPVDDFVRDFVRRLRGGELDEMLVYKKAVRKALDAYTKTTPPHVRAARLAAQPRRLIEYVMTTAGPEPTDRITATLDYDHYVEHQIKPVAEAVLRFVGRDFDSLIDARRQLALF